MGDVRREPHRSRPDPESRRVASSPVRVALAHGLALSRCGTTRAVVHLLEGDPAGALAHNPLATVAALAFVLGGLFAPIWLLCGGRAVAVSGRPGIVGIAAAVLIVLRELGLARALRRLI